MFVVALGDAGRARAPPWCAELRARGRRRPTPRTRNARLKAQLKMADRAGARFAAIIGDRRARGGHRDAPPARRTARRRPSRWPRSPRRLAGDGGAAMSERSTYRDRDAHARVRRAARRARRRRGDALRLGRAPPRSRRRHVHRPARPRGRGAGRVPPRGGGRGARGRPGSGRRGVVRVTGNVRQRPDGMRNPDLATGEVEVAATELEIAVARPRRRRSRSRTASRPRSTSASSTATSTCAVPR